MARRAVRPSAGDRLCGVSAEPRPDRQPPVRRPHRGAGARAIGPCRGGDRALVAAAPAAVHGRGMGQPAAVPVLLRFRAAPGRGGAAGPAALRVEWTLGDGSDLVLLANFGDTAVLLGEPVAGDLVYCSGAAPGREMAPACAAFLLRRAR